MAEVLSILSPLCATCSLRKRALEQAKRIAELERIDAALTKRLADLEARLAKHVNAHTPPSLKAKSFLSRTKNHRKRDRPPGYTGKTRPQLELGEVVDLTAGLCPRYYPVRQAHENRVAHNRRNPNAAVG